MPLDRVTRVERHGCVDELEATRLEKAREVHLEDDAELVEAYTLDSECTEFEERTWRETP